MYISCMHLNLMFSQCNISTGTIPHHTSNYQDSRVKLFWPGCFFYAKIKKFLQIWAHMYLWGSRAHRILTFGKAGPQLYKYNKTNNTDKWNWNLFESVSSYYTFLLKIVLEALKHGALHFKFIIITKMFKAY